MLRGAATLSVLIDARQLFVGYARDGAATLPVTALPPRVMLRCERIAFSTACRYAAIGA